jgi:NAD(P)-dependent dehydrogenase (short-subunit alcohol dehydrogenase family)
MLRATGTALCRRYPTVFDRHLESAQVERRRISLSVRGGRLVFVSSINQQKGMPMQSHYAASKGGIMQLARSMAIELAPHGIACDLIAPEAMLTDFNRPVMADAAHRCRSPRIRRPLRRPAANGIGGRAVLRRPCSMHAGQQSHAGGARSARRPASRILPRSWRALTIAARAVPVI